MGILGLWLLLKNKGYEATLSDQRQVLSATFDPTSRVLIDVLGSIFPTIRRAYSTSPPDWAHAIAELKLRELANPSNGILYLDGSPAAEKMLTHQGREDKREKALKAADKCTTQLMARVTEKLRVRKQRFHKIRKHLDRSFYWSAASRQAFAQYCRLKG
ncbi:hypothetical protein EDD21DRAFT_407728 [Dissophora ornata]|nr:hypothetical protein EDD21DRAFT_407728 [Dissophora ornata]